MVDKPFVKIAIVTLYDDINIGNKLQNYALQEILKGYSSSVETFTYTEAARISPALGWKGKLALKIGFPQQVVVEKKAIIKRKERFKEFSEGYLNTVASKPFSKFEPILNNEYDFFVVGSDQVWHNFSGTKEEIEYFFLRFADKEKRVCFAPSFGFDSIPEKFIDDYISGLKGFNTLSCREIEGCAIINELLGVKAVLLPDPTIVLTEDKWIGIEKKPDYALPDRFILAYFIGGKTPNQEESIKEYSLKMGLDIVDIFDKKQLNYFTTRPDEFIYLIRRAECVFTNSFHGTIFSILFRRRFMLFQRNDVEGKQMRSRLTTVIDEFKLQENREGFYVPKEDVCTILERKTAFCMEYLNKVFRLNDA